MAIPSGKDPKRSEPSTVWLMRDFIFPVRHDGELGLQAQLRRQLIDAIIDGRLSGSDPLPSCRRLAQSLGVSRNTVVLAYQALADEGLLISRERVGYFVNTDMVFEQIETKTGHPDLETGQAVDFHRCGSVRHGWGDSTHYPDARVCADRGHHSTACRHPARQQRL